MDTALHVESTVEEILHRVKDENATGLHVEAKTEEILQRSSRPCCVKYIHTSEITSYVVGTINIYCTRVPIHSRWSHDQVSMCIDRLAVVRGYAQYM